MTEAYRSYRSVHDVEVGGGELFHYTTLNALKGIMKSGSLWATSYKYTNDSTEVIHMQQLLRAALVPKFESFIRNARRDKNATVTALIEKRNGVKGLSRWIGSGIIETSYDVLFGKRGVVEKQPTYLRNEPFIVSFCTHSSDTEYERQNGLLSQWRAYGANDGVALPTFY